MAPSSITVMRVGFVMAVLSFLVFVLSVARLFSVSTADAVTSNARSQSIRFGTVEFKKLLPRQLAVFDLKSFISVWLSFNAPYRHMLI